MIVLVAHIAAVVTVEYECDSPVSIDIDCPLALAATLELVETKTRRFEVADIRSSIQSRQDTPDLLDVTWVNASHIASFEESLQTTVFETDDHFASVTRNVSRVNARLPCIG